MPYKSSYRNVSGAVMLLFALFWFTGQGSAGEKPDSLDGSLSTPEVYDKRPGQVIHRVGVDLRPEYIVPTHPFFRGENYTGEPIETSFSGHLKYAFQFAPGSYRDRLYGSAYQGIGAAYYTFEDKEQLGDPFGLYLFQGARIVQLAPRLSVNYEWNFGLSFGWKPYNMYTNEFNRVIGSRVNAYINADFYLDWMVSRRIDLMAGISLTHFSNGSTRLPNAGLNTIGLNFGLVYNFNRNLQDVLLSRPLRLAPGTFKRHMNYDLVLFGSWRRKAIQVGDDFIASPDNYTVLGFNFSSMYNLGYKFRVGLSLDGVYDGSANVFYSAEGGHSSVMDFETPSFSKQVALGVSARAEYVMPYFTVAIGMGTNIVHGGGELDAFYQVLALKIEMTRNSFIHIGYSLKQFKAPNFLMLGVGYRFNNKPQLYRP